MILLHQSRIVDFARKLLKPDQVANAVRTQGRHSYLFEVTRSYIQILEPLQEKSKLSKIASNSQNCGEWCTIVIMNMTNFHETPPLGISSRQSLFFSA